jgi:hypothetical protein
MASLSKKCAIPFHAHKLRNTYAVKKGYTQEEVAGLLGIEKWIIPDKVYEYIAHAI